MVVELELVNYLVGGAQDHHVVGSQLLSGQAVGQGGILFYLAVVVFGFLEALVFPAEGVVLPIVIRDVRVFDKERLTGVAALGDSHLEAQPV